jgi:hypothetical protein
VADNHFELLKPYDVHCQHQRLPPGLRHSVLGEGLAGLHPEAAERAVHGAWIAGRGALV